MKPIYQRVEDIRKSKGVTKNHLAKACKRTPAWYTDISNGRIRLSVEDLEKIADALNVDVRIVF